MKDFINEHFTVLVLVPMFVGCLFVTLHMTHHSADKENISWAREMTGGVMGAIYLALRGSKSGGGDGPKAA